MERQPQVLSLPAASYPEAGLGQCTVVQLVYSGREPSIKLLFRAPPPIRQMALFKAEVVLQQMDNAGLLSKRKSHGHALLL